MTKERIEAKIQHIFNQLACKDPKNAIHGTALAAAAIVALLPIGLDAWALRLCEIYMLISIYAHYEMKISKSVAESLMSAAFMQAVGEAAAYAALEAADAAAIASGGIGAPAAYAIKLGIAAAVIESVGWCTVKYLEGNKLASVAIHIADGIGVAADIGRMAGALCGTANASSDNIEPVAEEIGVDAAPSAAASGASAISFCGRPTYRIQMDVDQAEHNVKQFTDFVADDIAHGRNPFHNMQSLEFWKKKRAEFKDELAKALCA